jgi:hypothetical protein
MKRIRLPSPAMVVAMLALLVALSGTAVAAGIVPRAKVALNALKLQGKTAAQVAALAPAPTSVGGLVTIKTASWSLGAGGVNDFTVACDSGKKVTGGGYDGVALGLQNRPGSDGASWKVTLANLSDSSSSSGTLYAVCVA